MQHPQGLSIAVASPSDNEVMSATNNESQSDSPKWEIEHELDGFRFQVRFNTPHEDGDEKMTDTSADIPETAITAASILDAQNDIYKNFIIVDRRITVRDLKAIISVKVGIGLDELVFKRGGAHGVELLEDEDTLKQAQFYNHIGLYLKKGQPSI